MPLGTRDILLIIRAKDQASRVFADVGRAANTMSTGLARSGKLTGQELQRVGYAITGVGLAFAAAGAAGISFYVGATKAAMEYDRAARLTLTQVEDTKVSLEDIKRVGKEVALAIPAPFKEMQVGLYDIFSSIDVSLEGSKTLLTAFAKAAVTGNTTIEATGRATIAIMNAWQMEANEVGRVMDVQFQTVRKGVITYEEFANSIGRAIPSARKAGQSIEDLGGVISFLTRNGLSAAMAATSAARSFDLLANPKFAQRMRDFGVEVFDAKTKAIRPMAEVMEELGQKLKDLPVEQRTQALAQLTAGAGGVIQAMRFVNLAIADQIGLAEGEVGMLQQMTAWMHNAAGAMEEGYDIMRQTPEVQMVAFKNSVEILRTEIGDAFLPTVSKWAAIGVNLIKWFRDLDPLVKEGIVKFGAYASVGLLVVGGLTALAGAVVIFMGVWRQLNTALAVTTHIQLIPDYFRQWTAQAQAAAAGTKLLAAAFSTLIISTAVAATIAVIVYSLERYKTAVAESKEKWTGFIEEVRATVAPADQIDVLTEALEKQKQKLEELKKPWWEFTIISREGLFPDLAKMAAAKTAINEIQTAIDEGVTSTELGQKAMESLTLAFGEEEAAAMAAAAANEEAFVQMSQDAQKSAETIRTALLGTIDVIEQFGDSATTTAGDLEKFYNDQIRQAENFLSNIQKALDKGVNPDVLIRAMEAGVTKSGALVEKLANDSTGAMISTINEAEGKVEGLLGQSDVVRAKLETTKAELDKLSAVDAKPTISANDDDLREKVRVSKKHLDDLGTEKPTPKLLADPSDLNSKYNDGKNKIGDLNRSTSTSKLYGNLDDFLAKYQDGKGKLGDLNRSTATSAFLAVHPDLVNKYNDSKYKLAEIGNARPKAIISADAHQAKTEAESVLSKLRSIVSRGWNAVVRVTQKFVNADGGYYPTVSSFARGSEDHRAQIARAGAWRVWAEPETGGEAYIPLADSKRAQSEKILQLVASRFGFGLVPLREAIMAQTERRLMAHLRSTVPVVRFNNGGVVSSRPGPSSAPGGPPAPIINEGDTFNFIGRHESPEEIVAAVSFAKKTRGW